MRKVQVQNILTEKETQLNSLVKESTDAVSLITNTISRLETVNEQIYEKSEEISTYRAELDRIQGSMDQQIAHNEKIIGKFKSFLED
jgi:uncharacterized protein Yka (UPF0111/DUF47 family)